METTDEVIANTNQIGETMDQKPTAHIERLTNNEFRQVLDHLPLDDQLLVEIQQKNDWSYLYQHKSKLENEPNDEVFCGVCKEKFVWLSDEFTKHLLSDSHKQLLDKVQQFYHPIYTYDKSSEKPVFIEANKLKSKYQSARILANLKKTEAKLIEWGLNAHHKDFKQLVKVTMPHESLMNTNFKWTENKESMPMLRENADGSYTCMLCKESLIDASKINRHIKSKSHKFSQMKSFSMSNSEYETLTKNCLYTLGEEYSLSIDKRAHDYFNLRLSKIVGIEDKEAIQNIESKISSELYNKFKPLSKLVPSGMCSKKTEEAINNEGLIGVEYVVCMPYAGEHHTAVYTCVLCNSTLQIESAMQGHLIGTKHRLKYLEQHYPDTINKYKQKVNNNPHAISAVVQKFATAIEQEHGRSLCYTFKQGPQHPERSKVNALLHNYTHASQMKGPLFETLFSDEELAQLCKSTTNRDLFVPISGKSRFLNTKPAKNYFNSIHSRNKFWGRERSADCHRAVNYFPNTKPKHTTYNNRKKVSSTSDSFKSSSYIWQKYNDKCYNIGQSIEADYNRYRNYPESHPKYEECLHNFRRQRQLELQQRGINFMNYDFQSEWMDFFQQRMEEFYIETQDQALLNIRKYLNIPLEAEVGRDWMENSNPKQFDSGDRKRSSETNRDEHKRQRLNETNDFYQANRGCIDDADYSFVPPNPIEKPNIINVLRMLSALEDQLGSLGPTVVDLLSQSLTLQRKLSSHNPLELEKQILNTSNCDLLETTMEKLKGIMLAGLLDQSKQQGIQKIIMQTSELLEHANEMGWRNNEWSEKPQQSRNRSEPDLNSARVALKFSRQKLSQHRGRDQNNFNDMYQQNNHNELYSQMSEQDLYVNSSNRSYAGRENQQDYPSHSYDSNFNRSSTRTNCDNNLNDSNEMMTEVESNWNSGSMNQQNYGSNNQQNYGSNKQQNHNSNNSNNSEENWSGGGGFDHRSGNMNNYNRGSNSQQNYSSDSNFNNGSMNQQNYGSNNQQNYSSHNSNNSEGSWSNGGGFDHRSRNMNNNNSRTNREMNPDSCRMSSQNNSFNNNSRYERNSERDQNWGPFQQNNNSRYQ